MRYFKKHQQQQQTLKSFTYFQKKIKHAYKHVLVLKHVSAIQIHLYNFFYNLFFNCRTNRKYRSKIIYRIRTCLPFRARIVSTNYHQCWIDDQFEEKTLLKVSVTPIIKEFHCTYMFFFSLCHVLEYLYNWLLVYLSAKYYQEWISGYIWTLYIFSVSSLSNYFFFISIIW